MRSHFAEMMAGATTVRAMGTVRYEQEIQLDLINQWLHMAMMSRATYLWYSLHIKLMSLICMFSSLLILVSKKKGE